MRPVSISMAKKPHLNPPNQSFPNTERLFRRVRKSEIGRGGKVRVTAFELPDMSVNRERYGTAEEARQGHDPADWAVVAFAVAGIPPKKDWAHVAHVYRLSPRHVPLAGNLAHSEVRIWRKAAGSFVLITDRREGDFEEGDPDRFARRGAPAALLDPEFHMRWRKHIARAARLVLPCRDAPT